MKHRYCLVSGAGSVMLLVALWLAIVHYFALSTVAPPTPADDVAKIVFQIRALLDGKTPATPELSTHHPGLISIFCRGELLTRMSLPSSGEEWQTLDSRLAAARLSKEEQPCRIKLDLLRQRGPLPSLSLALAYAFVPGLDGVGLTLPERELLLTSDDLVRAGVFAAHRPVPWLEASLGIDWRATLRLLAQRSGLSSGQWRATPHSLFRFRADSYVESASQDGVPIAIFRGHLPPPPVNRATLRQAALDGGAYLVRHLHDDGHFDYEYDTITDAVYPNPADYSYPRHAGTTYFLAQLYAATRDPVYSQATTRALRFLVARPPAGCDRPDIACVGPPDESSVNLGATALALIAALEHRRSTASNEFSGWIRRWTNFILAMQRDDGEFCHLFDAKNAIRDPKTNLLYYSGEASFALAKMARDDPQPRYLTALTRVLDQLTGKIYAHLAGKFFFGEEHWTCLAVDEAWDLLPDDDRRARYGDFCEEFAAFMRRSQFQPGESILTEQPDLLGAYGFSPLLAPHLTPAGSRSEAVISCYRIANRQGHTKAARAMLEQLRNSMSFLLSRQISPNSAYLIANTLSANGAFYQSDVERQVRIDFIQHAGSALLRAADVLGN